MRAVDYAVRNIMVGDEEESRLIFDKATYLDGWPKEGVSSNDMKKLRIIMDAMNEDLYAMGLLEKFFDRILEILKPYISDEGLFDENFEKWQEKKFKEN